MRRLLGALLVCSLVSLPTFAAERRNAVVQAVAKAKDSIVTLKTVRPGSIKKETVGTGVVIDERGLVVTNKHVVGSGRALFVSFADGSEVMGDLLWAEPSVDLAVVRVKSETPLTALRLGTTSDLMIGEDVIAIGHPYGYVNTVSRGIVSAVGREITLPNGDVLPDLIQTDASINPGNSGGPLLNINGELIGINVALREGAQGIAFAIRAETVETTLAKHFSAVKVSGVMHGLSTQAKVVADAGDRRRLVLARESGGLRKGDEIVAVANTPVTNGFDLERVFWGRKPGDSVEIRVVREGRVVVASLTLTADPSVAAAKRD